MNILTTADLHLGRQSANLSNELQERSVTFTWNRIVTYAIDEKVDALLLAGDVVDRDNRFFEAIGPLQNGFERLGKAGIPVVMVSGNHDYDVLPDIIKNRRYDQVHLLGKKGRWETQAIDTKSGKLQIVGWSFPNHYVTEDPLLQLSNTRLNLDPNLPTVGLLHGDLYDRKSHYAPLDLTGFPTDRPQAWVLGHIHKPDENRRRGPLVFYPGSPQALSAKEPGIHGPVLLTIDGSAVHSIQIPLSPVRYEQLPIDVSGIDNQTEFRTELTRQMREFTESHIGELERVSYVIFDIELTGTHPELTQLDKWSGQADELEQQFDSETMLTVRKIKNAAEPVVDNLEEMAHQPTPPGMLSKLILELESGMTSELSNDLINELKEQIGSANRSGTYQPLSRFDEQVSVSEKSARSLLLKESRQLLGELLSQQEAS